MDERDDTIRHKLGGQYHKECIGFGHWGERYFRSCSEGIGRKLMFLRFGEVDQFFLELLP